MVVGVLDLNAPDVVARPCARRKSFDGYLYAMRGIPLRTAYTLATSLSIVGIASVGAIYFGETIGLRSGFGIALVIAGVALLTTG